MGFQKLLQDAYNSNRHVNVRTKSGDSLAGRVISVDSIFVSIGVTNSHATYLGYGDIESVTL